MQTANRLPKLSPRNTVRRLPRHLVFSCFVASFACGCATKNQRAINTIYDGHREYLVRTYSHPDPSLIARARGGEEGRNELLNDLILLVDMNYHETEKRLYGGKSWSDFLSSTAVIGINTAGALTGGEGVKTTLHALASALEGSRAAFDRDVLQNQGILAIIAKMRAQRAEQLLVLRGGMQKKIDVYSLQEGLVDLANYHNAGTVVGALQDIIDKAGEQKAKAQSTLNLKIKGLGELQKGLGE